MAPKQLPVRPTTDRAKEALFNILNHRLDWESTLALDLFSGTGNIAYELASRGVSQIIAVDQNIHCVRFISKTTSLLDLPIDCVKNSVEKFLLQPRGSFDFIFADPPYAFTEDALKALVTTLFEGNWLKSDGVFVLEHDSHLNISHFDFFESARKYGNSTFSFFEHNQ